MKTLRTINLVLASALIGSLVGWIGCEAIINTVYHVTARPAVVRSPEPTTVSDDVIPYSTPATVIK